MKKEKYYSSKEISIIIIFHVVIFFILVFLGISSYGLSGSHNNYDIWILFVIPIIFCLTPIIATALQRKNPKWGYLFFINVIILFLIIISTLLFSLKELIYYPIMAIWTIIIPIILLILYSNLILRIRKYYQ